MTLLRALEAEVILPMLPILANTSNTLVFRAFEVRFGGDAGSVGAWRFVWRASVFLWRIVAAAVDLIPRALALNNTPQRYS